MNVSSYHKTNLEVDQGAISVEFVTEHNNADLIDSASRRVRAILGIVILSLSFSGELRCK